MSAAVNEAKKRIAAIWELGANIAYAVSRGVDIKHLLTDEINALPIEEIEALDKRVKECIKEAQDGTETQTAL